MSRRLWGAAVLLICVIGGVWAANYYMLGRPLAFVLHGDSRNSGIDASAHFGTYVNPSIVVFDLSEVGPQNSPMDVFRTFVQFSASMKEKHFQRVELAHRGTTKFIIKGEYFAQLGAEYGQQNPMYTIRTFPEHLYRPDGTPAYGTWTGGVLGVLGKQMEDFADVHRKWYIDDLHTP